MIEKYNRTASLICKYLFFFLQHLNDIKQRMIWIKVDKLKQAWEKNLKTIEKLFVPVNAAHQSKEKKKQSFDHFFHQRSTHYPDHNFHFGKMQILNYRRTLSNTVRLLSQPI